MNPIVELEEVVKMYGATQALGPVDLRLEGQAVGLIGPNGAGKTTLIRLVMGLTRATSGTVRLLGDDVTETGPATRARIGYAPEGEAAFPDLTGAEAVAYAGRLAGLPAATAKERAHQVLDYVDLDEERYRLVENYSSGMRQRLKLAQALVHDPDLLILDEPTEAVDPETRRHLMTLLGDLREAGVRMLISTHLLRDLEELADHAVVLSDGRVAATGTMQELRHAQADRYQLRVNGSLDPVIAVLQDRSIPWAPMGTSIQAEVDHPRVLLDVAGEAGRVVRHLAPVERSLEDAFEDAVAHPLHSAATDQEEAGLVEVDGDE